MHRALRVSDGTQEFFVKLARPGHGPMLAAEADGLVALRATGSIRTPELIAQGAEEDYPLLVMEYLRLRPLTESAHGQRLAEALAEMHGHTGEQFGWHADNFIGHTPQANDLTRSWATFFAERRIRPQLELARNSGFDGELQRAGKRLLTRIPALFLDYRPQPSLLHGDLWHGNSGVTETGEPVIFDPAAYYGDAETDLAMSELFGGFPASFYATYRRVGRVSEDYERRKPLYNLYHILNHLNLFGRGYLGEALRLIDRLNRMLASDLN